MKVVIIELFCIFICSFLIGLLISFLMAKGII